MAVKISTQNNTSGLILLPARFIEEYMPKAPAAFSTVYIYAYAKCICGSLSLSTEDIAAALGMLASDVLKAWAYWEEKGVLTYEQDGDAIVFLDLQNTLPAQAANTLKRIAVERKPSYSPEELDIYCNKSSDVKQLFASASEFLGKMLSYNDMSTLFSFYDWLRLPMDVIELLLAYCVQNGHTSMRYIEKVAVDWADSGVNTAEKARDRVRLYSSDYRQIMKAFGQGGRTPVESEERMIKRWLGEYNMSLSLITLACRKTIEAIGKPSFQYAESILLNWSKNKVKTEEDVKALEESFQKSKQEKTSQSTASKVTAPQNAAPKKNRFVNYEQRKWDFDELERLSKEKLRKEGKE